MSLQFVRLVEHKLDNQIHFSSASRRQASFQVGKHFKHPNIKFLKAGTHVGKVCQCWITLRISLSSSDCSTVCENVRLCFQFRLCSHFSAFFDASLALNAVSPSRFYLFQITLLLPPDIRSNPKNPSESAKSFSDLIHIWTPFLSQEEVVPLTVFIRVFPNQCRRPAGLLLGE